MRTALSIIAAAVLAGNAQAQVDTSTHEKTHASVFDGATPLFFKPISESTKRDALLWAYEANGKRMSGWGAWDYETMKQVDYARPIATTREPPLPAQAPVQIKQPKRKP